MSFIDPRVIHDSAARGDSRFPYATWKPLPENSTQARIQPTQFIMHTEASGGRASNQASWNYWARSDINVEAHFLLAMDPSTEPLGGMWQTMDIFVRADNNLKANARAVSIETQDWGGATVNATPWTNYQLDMLGALLAWLHLNSRVNLVMQRCPTWDSPGYAPHNAFPGDWSAAAHSCPGVARTAQVPQVVERAWAIINWRPTPTPTPSPEETDVRTVRIHIAGRNAEFWTQAPVFEDGPSILEVVWSGPGGPEYDQFVANHAANGRLVEVTYDPSVTKNWFLVGDPAAIPDTTHSWSAADFRGIR